MENENQIDQSDKQNESDNENENEDSQVVEIGENDNSLKELVETSNESIEIIKSYFFNSYNKLSSLEIAAFIIPILAFYLLYKQANLSN